MESNNLHRLINSAALTKKSPAGEDYRALSLSASKELAKKNGISRQQVEIAALETGIIPERYQRSLGTVGLEGQIRLLKSTVGVVGAGGLGGFVMELMARMGVGRILVVDDDVFADSNLNRQLLANENNLHKPKADAAAKRVSEINGAVSVKAFCRRGDASNLVSIFEGCDLVLDCLDNLSSRYDLEKVSRQLGVIMIHGAIAGFLGQLAVIRPEYPLLEMIYGASGDGRADKGAEVQLGNPATTPAMLASWQANEAVKILAGLESVLPRDKMLIIDMQTGESYRIEVTAG